jgi:hypothetical protein
VLLMTTTPPDFDDFMNSPCAEDDAGLHDFAPDPSGGPHPICTKCEAPLAEAGRLPGKRRRIKPVDATTFNMPQARYVAAVERLRAFIAGGRALLLDDCNDTGHKHTECSWGLCAGDLESWPDVEDHLWPEKFPHYEAAEEEYQRALKELTKKSTRQTLNGGPVQLERPSVTPKYLRGGQFCPMDRRAALTNAEMDGETAGLGCFYHCCIFQAAKGKTPTRAEALQLYDVQLERVKKRP